MATSVTQSHIFGTKDVATPGTQLAIETTHYPVSSVLIIAHSDNAGRIFYGGDDIDSSIQKGLEPGESVSFGSVNNEPFPIESIYIDAANANDGVDFIAVRARGSNT